MLAQSLPVEADKSVDSVRITIDSFHNESDLLAIKNLAFLLGKLKGKKVESIEWVTTYDPFEFKHVGFFRVKTS